MKVNTTIGIQLIPIGEMDNKTKYQMIDDAINFLKAQPKIKCFVGPLETTIEGEYDDCFNILKEMVNNAKLKGYTLFVNIKIICHPDAIMTIDQKVNKFN